MRLLAERSLRLHSRRGLCAFFVAWGLGCILPWPPEIALARQAKSERRGQSSPEQRVSQESPNAPVTLREALELRDRRAFGALLAAGADWRGAGIRDDDVLSIAVALDAADGVAALLDRGFAVDGLDRNAETPLYVAADAGASRSANLLLRRGADPSRVVRSARAHGWTPLFAAVIAGRGGVAGLLVGNGFDVDVEDDFGRTPLFYAALHGQASLVRLLLARRADPRRRDHEGRTPRDVAAMLGFGGVVRMLEAASGERGEGSR